jgi:hypothetical protein
MIEYNEAKRQANIIKHGLDLADAHWVYDAVNKVTIESMRNNENRLVDIALVELHGVVLALVYVMRGSNVRAISLRRASKAERTMYECTK